MRKNNPHHLWLTHLFIETLQTRGASGPFKNHPSLFVVSFVFLKTRYLFYCKMGEEDVISLENGVQQSRKSIQRITLTNANH